MATRYGLTGTVAAAGAAILAVLIALSPSERAQSLGLTQHGALITAQDAGAADAVATVAVSPGTAGQVLTVSDAGLPHWAAAASSSSLGATIVDPATGGDWAETEAASTSATWAASVLTLSALSGATGAVEVSHAAVIPAGAQEWDLAVRVQVTAGDTSQTTSSTGYILAMLRLDADNYVAAVLYANSTLVCLWRVGGGVLTNSGSLTPAPNASQRTGGQLWLRISGDTAGRWVLSWGAGSAGALPTVWQRVYTIDSAPLSGYAMATAQLVLINGSSGGAARAAAHTVDVLAIRSSWRGSL